MVEGLNNKVGTRHADTSEPLGVCVGEKFVPITFDSAPPSETILFLKIGSNEIHYYIAAEPLEKNARERYPGVFFIKKLTPTELEKLKGINIDEEDMLKYLTKETLKSLEIKRPVAGTD